MAKVSEVQRLLANQGLAPSLEATFANGLVITIMIVIVINQHNHRHHHDDHHHNGNHGDQVLAHGEPLTGQEVGHALASPTLAQVKEDSTIIHHHH